MKGQISTGVRRVRVSKRVAVVAAVLFGLVGILPYLAVTQEQKTWRQSRRSNHL